MGTIFWIPVINTRFLDFIQWCRRNQVTVIGTTAHGKDDFRDIKQIAGAKVLLLGSEQKGLSGDQLEVCHTNVSIPMRGRCSSLNLAVAAGILLYAMTEG